MIDSVYRKDKSDYLQVLFEECIYDVTEKKISKFITGDIEIYSDDSDNEDSDEENFDEKNRYRNLALKKYKRLFKLRFGKFHPKI